jgi:hypothetical protein
MISKRWLLAIVVLVLLSLAPGDPFRDDAEPLTNSEIERLRPYWLGSEAQYIYSSMEWYWMDAADFGNAYKGGNYMMIACFFWDNPHRGYIVRWYDTYRYNIDRAEGCVAHELGHAIDYRHNRPSQTEAFKRAVAFAYAANYEEVYNSIVYNFPGTHGHILSRGQWGGYGELYASLFETESLRMIPTELRIFFVDWFAYTDGIEIVDRSNIQ